MFYDGSSNQYGIYSQTSSAADPTSAVVGFSNVSGNSTYGYLGYNGTYSYAGQTINGSAVYGLVDDPDRVAGFFRTTGTASMAANVNYSNVWIANYNYVENSSGDYNPTASYSQLDVSNSSLGGYQVATKGYSNYTAGSGNSGYSTGGMFVGNGDTQDAYGTVGVASCTGSACGVGVYGESSDNASGSDYFNNNIGAVEGYGAWGTNTYNFGVTGRVGGTGNRQGGVLGTWYTSDFGILGYQNSGGTAYGLLYVGGSSTTAKSTNPKTSIGMGGYGDLMGGWIRGNLYGLHLKGDRYTLYVDGKQYTNDVITQLSENRGSDSRNVAYVNTSTSVDIQTKGQFTLTQSEQIITFNRQFTEQVSSSEPIILTLTPQGGFVDLYIEYINPNECKIIADFSDKQTKSIKKIKVNWIAIGTRKGYESNETPIELLSNDYDLMMDGVMHNESNTQTDAKPIWWDGNNLQFSKQPATNKEEIKKTEFQKLNASKNKKIRKDKPLNKKTRK